MASCKYLNVHNVCTQTNTEPSKDVRFNTCLTSKQYDCTYYKKANSSSCFITSAVCEAFGRRDDCHELMSMRSFRDNWLRKQPGGEAEIEEYYALAPQIVAAINAEDNSGEIYSSICEKYIIPCVDLANGDENDACYTRYKAMIECLQLRSCIQ